GFRKERDLVRRAERGNRANVGAARIDIDGSDGYGRRAAEATPTAASADGATGRSSRGGSASSGPAAPSGARAIAILRRCGAGPGEDQVAVDKGEPGKRQK